MIAITILLVILIYGLGIDAFIFVLSADLRRNYFESISAWRWHVSLRLFFPTPQRAFRFIDTQVGGKLDL